MNGKTVQCVFCQASRLVLRAAVYWRCTNIRCERINVDREERDRQRQRHHRGIPTAYVPSAGVATETAEDSEDVF